MQSHDHSGFGPLPDQKGACDGHGHQGMDAQLQAQQITHAGAIDAKPRQAYGQNGHGHAQELPEITARADPVAGFRQQGGRQCRAYAWSQHAAVMGVIMICMVVLLRGGAPQRRAAAAAAA